MSDDAPADVSVEVLLDNLNRGDVEAAEQVFVRYEPYLRLLVRRRLSAPLRAKFDSIDVVQSVWADLLDGFSLEMTAKDIPSLNEAAPLIPKGTRISVTFLPNEAFEDRVAAAAAVRRHGFVPIPHLSARRIGSERELDDYLARLSGEAGIDHAFVIAGDPPEPLGPYEDALAILKSGLLSRHGVKHVGISGYPEGHPDIASGYSNLAQCLAAQGKDAAALPLAQTALRLRREALGEAHPDYAAGLNNLANLYWSMGDHARAWELFNMINPINHGNSPQEIEVYKVEPA
jgi:tetratricopeptide (TPR) repeat protein